MANNAVMVIITSEDEREFAGQIASALGYPNPEIIVGTPVDAANSIKNAGDSPSFVIVDIGDRGFDILPELDQLAECCQEDTRVVMTGSINDVTFYRELRQRGVIEYFTRPVKISDLRRALVYEDSGKTNNKSEILTFFSAASGDGSSTVALNVAYCLANNYRKSVVIIDMDFQFGMIARNLDLSTPFGIKELFEHPERSIDATLIDRMLIEYGENLKVIAAPSDLRYFPQIKPEMVRDLLHTLKQRFDYIIIDLPHVWSNWSTTTITDANRIFMTAQLWLRSLTHTTRLLTAWKDIGVDENKISLIINRSGAKFKEAISDKDFERASGKKIDFFLANDIKTVVAAENQGRTITEIGVSLLEKQFRDMAAVICGQQAADGGGVLNISSQDVNQTERKSGLLSRFKK